LTTKTRVNFLDDPIRASLTEASVVEFAANDTERTLPVNLQYFVEDSGWAHLGYGSIDGAIFFPVTEVRPGSRLVVTTDAVLGGRSSGPASAVDVTYATKGLVIRQPWELGKTFEVPDDTTRVRVDLPVEAASTLRIQKVVLRRLE
jgi:hypothetical protein